MLFAIIQVAATSLKNPQPRIVAVRGSGLASTRRWSSNRALPRKSVPKNTTASTPPIVASHIQTVGVKRPGFGTNGKAIRVTVNAFETKIPQSIIYQYDVITPEIFFIRTTLQLFDVFQTSILKVFDQDPPRPLVYDGRKIAFAMYDLELGPHGKEFEVPFRLPGSPTENVYKMKLTKTSEINTEALHRFISGQQAEDRSVSMALTALNVAIRMQPNLKYPCNGRSFFPPEGKKNIGAGLEVWQGYFQSLRPSWDKIYTITDTVNTVVYSPTHLIDTCTDFLRLQHPTQLEKISQGDRKLLEHFIRGLGIKTTHQRERRYVIKGIAHDSARTHTFTKEDGTSTTAEEYFRGILSNALKYPLIPCVDVGRGRMIPMELCEVLPEQFMRKKFPDDRIKMADHAKRHPRARLDAIRNGLQVMNYSQNSQSPYLRAFGLDISKTPMNVNAHVLTSPTLRCGGASMQATNGQWNMRDKQFFQPAKIRKWAIVSLESMKRFNEGLASKTAKQFVQYARRVGIQIPDVTSIRYANDHKDFGKILQDLKGALDLIVVILPDENKIYPAVKYFGDVVQGVPTQCLKMKCTSNRTSPQYWANVMLKVNAKLGGINWILKDSALHDPKHPTIVMGADVMHPFPGADDNVPSITALVSSVDRYTAKYIAITRAQRGNMEIISDLEEMVRDALRKYRSYRKEKEGSDIAPDRLIFYRDGVSTGEFQAVLDQELAAVQRACQAEKVNPKITLIIVGKQHHIRMFPLNSRDADKSGNCLAGTTIDKGIGHPNEFDYYQLTHGSLLGTGRPAHYSVIHDDNNFSVDTIQNFSFALAHLYAPATRSVSIPAPVYYADKACSRSSNHYAPAGSRSDHERQQTEYKPLNRNLENVMYFL